LLSQYNQGSSRDPASFLALFTLIGLIYGLLSGIVLALVTLKLRYSWLPLLFSVLGGGIGGMFLGLVIWRHNFFLALPTLQLQLIVFFLYLALALAGLIGGLLALAYDWVRRKRAERADRNVEPGRAQDYVTIGAGLLVLALVINSTNTFVNFITIHTGSTTTSLDSETQGVGWSSPTTLGEQVIPSDGSTSDVAADPAGRLAAVWNFDQEGSVQIAYAFQTGEDSSGTATWSPPVSVSNSTTISRHPQLAIGTDGRAHLVWSEQVSPGQWEIRYTSCSGDQCNSPISLATAQAASCQSAAGQGDWPAIAVAQDGSLGIAWNAGGLLAYTITQAAESPSASAVSCLTPAQGANPQLQPRLAAGAADQFSMVYGTGNAEASGPIHLLAISPDGAGSETEAGQGRFPEIDLSPDGQIRLAWCTSEGYLNTSLQTTANALVETIQSPPCINRPALLQDSQGQMHLVWYSNQVANVYGNQQPGHFLYESIRMNNAWTQPAIFSTLNHPAEPADKPVSRGFAALCRMLIRTHLRFMAEQPLISATLKI
jgi:hypothetical protein